MAGILRHHYAPGEGSWDARTSALRLSPAPHRALVVLEGALRSRQANLPLIALRAVDQLGDGRTFAMTLVALRQSLDDPAGPLRPRDVVDALRTLAQLNGQAVRLPGEPPGEDAPLHPAWRALLELRAAPGGDGEAEYRRELSGIAEQLEVWFASAELPPQARWEG